MPACSTITIIPLSPTEQRVVAALLTGATNKIIARELGISPGTVKVHLKSILKKAGASSRTQAALKLFPQVAAIREAERAMEAEFSGPLVLATWRDRATP